MKRTDITELFPDATAEQIDKIMSLNGADINAAKAGIADLQSKLTEAESKAAELAKRPTSDALSALQAELNELKATNAIRDIRDAVSKDKGVPASLLTGNTKEDCETQAQSILDFAKSTGYPSVPDGGDPQHSVKLSARDAFAAWGAENL